MQSEPHLPGASVPVIFRSGNVRLSVSIALALIAISPVFAFVPGSELFYLGLCGVALSVWGIALHKDLGATDVFSPFFITGATFILYFVIVVMLYFAPEAGWRMSETTLTLTLIYMLFFCFAAHIGMSMTFGDEIACSMPRLYQGYAKRRLALIAIVSVPIGLALFLYLMRKAGFTNPLAILTNVMAFRETWGSEGLTYLLYISLYLLSAPFWAWIIRGRLSVFGKIIAALYFLVLSFIDVLTGLRYAMYASLIGILYVYHSCVRRVSLTRAIQLGLIMLVPLALSFMIFGIIRSDTKSHLASVASKVSTGNSIYRLLLRAGWAANGFAKIVSHADHVPTEWGESFVDVWYLPVPRAWVRDKPSSFNAQMLQEIEPRNNSRFFGESFSIFGEFYVNFGVAGLLAGGLLFGILMRTTQRYYVMNANNRRFVLIYQPLVALPYFYMASGLINSWVHALLLMNLVQAIALLKLLGRPGSQDAIPAGVRR